MPEGMQEGIIFDFNWTLYDPRRNGPSEGAIDILQKLKEQGEHVLCVVSCCISGIDPEERRKQIAEDFGDYFDHVVVLPYEKTVEDFQRCAEQMGLPPRKIIAIGDRIGSEITFANQLGMATVRYRDQSVVDGQPAKYAHLEETCGNQDAALFQVDHLRELENILISPE